MYGTPGRTCDCSERNTTLKIISWNLLRRTGAAVDDIVALIERQRPDLLVLQEAVAEVEGLAAVAGGYCHREPLPARTHGLAIWSPQPLAPASVLALPVSPMPGRLPPRIAQLVRFGDVTFANVHLSHGQLLNRRQLVCIARSIDGPAAIIGDFNAIGPILLPGFRDVGPREPTHLARNVLPVRLDRCLVRELHCAEARVLDRGPSDHRPIILKLKVGSPPIRSPKRVLRIGRGGVGRSLSDKIAAMSRGDAGVASTG